MLHGYPQYVDRDPEYQRLMRRIHNARTKTKIHHETCPVCGAKLVNLYRRSLQDRVWKCRECWEKFDAEAAENDTPRCKTCQTQADALKSETPCVCNWYLHNVINGDKSTKSCSNYKPVEVDSDV